MSDAENVQLQRAEYESEGITQSGDLNSNEPMLIAAWPETLQIAWQDCPTLHEVPQQQRNVMRRALETWFGAAAVPELPTPDVCEQIIESLRQCLNQSQLVVVLRGVFEALNHIAPDQNWTWFNQYVQRERHQLWADNPNWQVNDRNGGRRYRRTHSLDVKDWPKDIRQKWLAIKETNSVSRDYAVAIATTSSPISGCSSDYVRRLERGLGRYLRFVDEHNVAVDEPTIESVHAWIGQEHEAGLAPKSTSSFLFEVWRTSTLIWPDHDFDWLIEWHDRLNAEAYPVRRALDPTITLAHLRQLGWDLMEETRKAPPLPRTAVKFRDGLMIALLTEKPMRVRNLHQLTIQDFWFDEDGAAVLDIGLTKNRHSDLAALSPDLGRAIQFWIEDMRPRLCLDGHETGLWIGQFGKPLENNCIYQVVRKRTQQGLGVAIGPHRFRHLAAHAMAMHAPDQLPSASAILGHRDPKSISSYAGLAEAAGAAAMLDEYLADFVMPTKPREKKQGGQSNNAAD